MWDDEIGVSTSPAPKWSNISVPYGSLVPVGLDGALGAGRHVACDASSHTFLREIPQCWLTGQAAGVAAALAADAGIASAPASSSRQIQRAFLRQGAYLSPGHRSDAADRGVGTRKGRCDLASLILRWPRSGPRRIRPG